MFHWQSIFGSLAIYRVSLVAILGAVRSRRAEGWWGEGGAAPAGGGSPQGMFAEKRPRQACLFGPRARWCAVQVATTIARNCRQVTRESQLHCMCIALTSTRLFTNHPRFLSACCSFSCSQSSLCIAPDVAGFGLTGLHGRWKGTVFHVLASNSETGHGLASAARPTMHGVSSAFPT